MDFGNIVEVWKSYGIFEFYLPFVLMFTIFYGLLSRSKLFGDPSKEKRVTNINIVISIVAALFVMVYPPTGVTLTTFFGTFFTQTMVVLTTVLCFALILFMMIPSGTAENLFSDPTKYAKYLVPFALITVLIIFFAAGGLEIFGIKLGRPGVPGTFFPSIGLSTEDLVLIILILLFILLLFFLRGGEKEEKPTKRPKGYRWELVPEA